MNSYRVVYASAQKLLTEYRQTQLAIIITQKVIRVTHIIFILAFAQNVLLQHKCKR